MKEEQRLSYRSACEYSVFTCLGCVLIVIVGACGLADHRYWEVSLATVILGSLGLCIHLSYYAYCGSQGVFRRGEDEESPSESDSSGSSTESGTTAAQPAVENRQ